MRKFVIAVAGLLASTSPALAETVVIRAGSVLRDAASEPTGPATITVTDGKIVSVVPGSPAAPAGAREVDLSGKTVVPGLIDLHVHLTSDPGTDYRNEAVEPDEWGMVVGAKNALLTLKAGFTTVREAGSAQYTGYSLRRGTAEGLIAGPRIVAAGPALSIVGGHGDVTGFREEVHAALDYGYTCTGPVECAEKVRKASRAGADVIKITSTGGVLSQQGRGLDGHFTPAELESIMTTAHTLGLKVMAHAHGARGIESAVLAGVDTIEHGTFADEAALKAMKAKGTFMVPTLMALEGVRARLGKGVYTPTVEAKGRLAVEAAGKQVQRSKQLGVPVAFGTDAGVFEHGRNGEEFALLVKNGLTNREALASATTVAAKALGLENEIGQIAPGFSADLIAVDANPLADVRTLEKPSWVMVRGRIAP